ncbi:hypothetical protein CRI94_08670 [Longibacter salinarum]|uniref:DUF1684 domain-containing protein n=1 Tax=Longibacter salinarum TaxID=1850348 RepID=A0A2A8CXQ3_9BACT|nr:DUF1684 domain-containing protein [Longibacter salinarum]PEN13391.1 hypothetical protein CRI94_08670 [Longibacter salinarum]
MADVLVRNNASAIAPRGMWILGMLLLCTGLAFAGCGNQQSEKSYADRITQERVSRDMEMRGDRSVIPAKQRKSFRGLQYYDIDSTYRFVRPVDRPATPDTVRMAQSTGGVADQLRVGTVAIPFPQRGDTLAVFEVTEGEERGQWWIPFTDETNGGTTYKLGRYVDVEKMDGDSVIVDFNTAYNPTCAYNPRFACPIPPEENALAFDVPVGEQKPLF